MHHEMIKVHMLKRNYNSLRYQKKMAFQPGKYKFIRSIETLGCAVILGNEFKGKANLVSGVLLLVAVSPWSIASKIV